MNSTDTKVYDHEGNYTEFNNIDRTKGFKEHCPFKFAPCNYNGWGWYDRCAGCKDNNGFVQKNINDNKPF